VSCGKTAERMSMPLCMAGREYLRMCSVYGSVDRPTEKENFVVDMGRPIVTDGEFVALLCENV